MQLTLFILEPIIKQDVENPTVELEVGDTVLRKWHWKENNTGENVQGKVVEKLSHKRCKIKWNLKASNGQQHTTIQDKFLVKWGKSYF